MIIKHILCIASVTGAMTFSVFAQGGFGTLLSEDEYAEIVGADDLPPLKAKFGTVDTN